MGQATGDSSSCSCKLPPSLVHSARIASGLSTSLLDTWTTLASVLLCCVPAVRARRAPESFRVTTTAASIDPVLDSRSLCGFGGLYFGGFTYYRAKQPGADPVFWNNLHAKEFWDEIPALVKDGTTFLQSGGQKTAHFSQYAAVDDVEAAPKKRPPAKKKAALPPKKSGPPPRKSGSSDDGADDDNDDEEESN